MMVVVVVVVVSRGLTAAAARGSKGQRGPLPPGKRNCTVYKDVAGAGAYGVFCGGGSIWSHASGPQTEWCRWICASWWAAGWPCADNVGAGITGGIGASVGGVMSFAREQFERRFTDVSYDLLISKTFYFFFYAAFGSVSLSLRFDCQSSSSS